MILKSAPKMPEKHCWSILLYNLDSSTVFKVKNYLSVNFLTPILTYLISPNFLTPIIFCKLQCFCLAMSDRMESQHEHLANANAYLDTFYSILFSYLCIQYVSDKFRQHILRTLKGAHTFD